MYLELFFGNKPYFTNARLADPDYGSVVPTSHDTEHRVHIHTLQLGSRLCGVPFKRVVKAVGFFNLNAFYVFR